MLQRLHINNYALIDALDVNFSAKLNIITGETGAGKSILLGALSLLLGNRADTSMLLNKEKKCIVEGEFLIDAYHLQEFFASHDLDYDAQTIIRREISPESKSRAFVNDMPVNLQILKELGKKLIDIHSQHETLSIGEAAFQLSVLDAFAGHQQLLLKYKAEYVSFIQMQKQLDEWLLLEQKSRADEDYFRFQFQEIEVLNLKRGEQESLEKELEVLSNATEVKTGLAQTYFPIDQSENSITSVLHDIQKSLSQIFSFYEPALNLADRIRQAMIELKDIAAEAEKYEQSVQMDPARVTEIQERLDAIYNLEQKHRLNTLDELLDLQNSLSDKLLAITSMGEKIEVLQKDLQLKRENLLQIAQEISSNRKKAAPQIQTDMENMLKSISMPHARLNILVQAKMDTFFSDGIDKVQFQFSANKGMDFNDLAKVASGGELSRLMLCLKALIAKKISLPCMVFDEIDSGISGEVALKVGGIMEHIANTHQVIAITHLPQLAGRGDCHWFVYKETDALKTSTGIRKLGVEERVVEIARMIAGDNPSEVALQHAKELMQGE